MAFPFKSPKPSSLKAKTVQALCIDVSIHDMLQPEPTAFGVLHMPLFNSCRFEAGTPAIAEAIGLGATVDYLSGIGMERIHDYEVELANYLYNSLLSVPKVRIYGPVPSQVVKRAALCSFNIEDIHPTDIATFLDQQHGVAVRSGHHCAQPLHRCLGINASARASLHFYNTKEDVDNFIRALTDTISFFSSFK